MNSRAINEIRKTIQLDKEIALQKVLELIAAGVNRTVISRGVYVGSGCNLVAPLKINANEMIAAGSNITDEVAADTLTIARSRQVKIENWKKSKLRR